MHREIARQWVNALRSGRYQQGRGALNCNGKYCCLGVLCELAFEAGATQRFDAYSERGCTVYGTPQEKEGGYLPKNVQEWAGLKSENVRNLRDFNSASALNDSGWSFAQIADLIETKFVGSDSEEAS